MKTRRLLVITVIVIAILELFFYSSQLFSASETSFAEEVVAIDQRHRGAHVFGIGDTTNLKPLEGSSLEWLTLVPWGFQKDYTDTDVGYQSSDSIRNAEYDQFWVRRIKNVRKQGYKVFVKPHVWLDTTIGGKWRSAIYPETAEAWKTWSDSYRGFILKYAKNAEAAGAEMFCVGMELTRLALEKPQFWRELIADVRKVYSGKLTYGANWYEEFEQISFWDDLDYIGVQAYFPLAENDNATAVEIAKNWDKYLPTLAAVSTKFDRKILFTEMGYKSTANGAIKPWEWAENEESKDNVYSEAVQAACYRVFFDKVWNQPWMAGAYFWQMRIDFDGSEEYQLDFTPQCKSAMDILTEGYQREVLE